MSAQWTITGPSGTGTVILSAAEVESLAVSFRIMATSTAQLSIHRDFDSVAAWWAEDTMVTIYRAPTVGGTAVPFFTGRVLETPIRADGSSEYRTLSLADAWQDLEDIIYQEAWGIGAGSVLIPKAILGMNAAGAALTTGEQIEAAVTYAMTQGAAMTLGVVDGGVSVWPSEVVNISCADVILGELRWNPDYVAWLDHSTAPVTFRARAKSELTAATINVADEGVASFQYAKLIRNIPRGVRILYEDAASVGDTVYRNGYLDTAGATTGRKIMHATIELAGLNVQLQKSRIETRTLPTDGATMTAYFKKKWPELVGMPDGAFEFGNVTFTLAPEATQPDPINPRATRIHVDTAADLPRELVRGSIEDWMRRKVGQVTVQYDLTIIGTPTIAQKKILDNFSGIAKTFTITATNAVTKLYKGITSYTEGESVPVGIAAAVYAAASADKYEGQITLAAEDVPATIWLGKTIRLMDGATELMPGMTIHSASMDIDQGMVSISFGPLPYLSAGDFLELQRMVKGRPVTWMSAEERASNELGAESAPGAKGDTVSGYDQPETIVPPGGGARKELPFEVTLGIDGATYYVQVAHGKIIERDMTRGAAVDALPSHVCTNRMDGANPRKFTITTGQSICVVVEETNLGAIDAATGIILSVGSTSTTKSLNYIPGVQDGIYYYKLASLVTDGAGVKLVNEIAGGHIFHPTGLTADLVLRDCPYHDGEVTTPGAQLLRGTFVSGKLAATGLSEASRAYAPTLEETSVMYCS